MKGEPGCANRAAAATRMAPASWLKVRMVRAMSWLAKKGASKLRPTALYAFASLAWVWLKAAFRPSRADSFKAPAVSKPKAIWNSSLSPP